MLNKPGSTKANELAVLSLCCLFVKNGHNYRVHFIGYCKTDGKVSDSQKSLNVSI